MRFFLLFVAIVLAAWGATVIIPGFQSFFDAASDGYFNFVAGGLIFIGLVILTMLTLASDIKDVLSELLPTKDKRK